MNDRELLEWAAKAAGIEIDKSPYNGGWAGNTGFDVLGNAVLDWHNGETWNPLTDSGDNQRLAVKLRMSIDHNHPADQQPWVVAERQGCEGCFPPVCCIEDEFDEAQRDAATRRAVVRAAAEIGKAMQENATARKEPWSVMTTRKNGAK